MNKTRIFSLTLIAALTAGCAGVKTQGPALKNPAPKLAQAKDTLKKKKPSVNMPQTLGGIVSSDSWIVYPEKQQEEFKGRVSYDNGVYVFRSDYALSDRAKNTFSAAGNIYIKQAEKGSPVYEARADKGFYNYKTANGRLTANPGRFVHLVYTDVNGTATRAQARKAAFNVNAQTYNLYEDVTVTRPTQQGTATVKADRVSARQADQYAVLEGNASLSTPQYSLTADTIVLDGKNNQSYAYGSRALARGTTEQGTFALIADRAEAENESKKIRFTGNVQGWLVSDEINQADVNDKF